MAHPSVAEAAVIAVPHGSGTSGRSRRSCCLPRSGDAEELREFLGPRFAKWWLPDRYEFVDEIPKTAVGKFRKTALREQFPAAAAAASLIATPRPPPPPPPPPP